ncbi:hypothetical protein [Streptomyces brevispora]|uniref:Uncharacterized protein n=1 Tax=Streptomyces brevispora TaxID=887462 RepID=A0ABZ1FZI7_9ACTN|nr:hypothetical protein [Streptomyces brevispora]WSC12359.1 hypothetical protein OIE64_05540 [Streptomyces brevispora]
MDTQERGRHDHRVQPDVNAYAPSKSAKANSTPANRRSTAHRALTLRPNDPSAMCGTLSTTTICHAGRVGPT